MTSLSSFLMSCNISAEISNLYPGKIDVKSESENKLVKSFNDKSEPGNARLVDKSILKLTNGRNVFDKSTIDWGVSYELIETVVPVTSGKLSIL